MRCSYCGKEITNPNARFCSGCGRPLQAGPAAQQAQPQRTNRASGVNAVQPPRGGPKNNAAMRGRGEYYSPDNRKKSAGPIIAIVAVLMVALLGFGAWFVVSSGVLADLLPRSIVPEYQDTPDSSFYPEDTFAPEDDVSVLPETTATPVPEPAVASETQVVLRNAKPDGKILVDGVEVPFEYVGSDAVVQRQYLPDLCQIRIVASDENGQYQTAAVWYNYRYGNELTFGNPAVFGDANAYGEYLPCDADGKAEPSDQFINVLTWAYYQGFLQCINNQTMSFMVYSTAGNTSDASNNVYSSSNQKNTYNMDDFTAVCDPNSIQYTSDGRVIYNAYFRSTATNRSSGESKEIVNQRTIELVWEDSMWKVNRQAFLSDSDYEAGNYADLG